MRVMHPLLTKQNAFISVDSINNKRVRAKPLNLRIELPKKLKSAQSYPASGPLSISSFSGIATEILKGIYVGDINVAQNKVLLDELGIDFIINCVSQHYSNQFPNDYIYMNISMKDNPAENIFCLFYDAIEFIEESSKKGKVLIHCKSGISRSTAIAISYIMYKEKCSYQIAFDKIYNIRPICTPNAGFIISLKKWQSHLSDNPLSEPRLYLIEPNESNESNEINSNFNIKQQQLFDSKSNNCYILHTNDKQYIWIGNENTEGQIKLAMKLTTQLTKYENAPKEKEIIYQSKETESFNETINI